MITESQLKEILSIKVVMALRVRCKNSAKLGIMLHYEDFDGAQDIGNNTGDKYIKVEMPFNSLMTEVFEDSYVEELLQRMFAHIKTQAENPRMPGTGFTLDQIM